MPLPPRRYLRAGNDLGRTPEECRRRAGEKAGEAPSTPSKPPAPLMDSSMVLTSPMAPTPSTPSAPSTALMALTAPKALPPLAPFAIRGHQRLSTRKGFVRTALRHSITNCYQLILILVNYY